MKKTISVLLIMLMLLGSTANAVTIYKDILPKNGNEGKFYVNLLRDGTTASNIVYGQSYNLRNIILWLSKEEQTIETPGMDSLINFAYALKKYSTITYGSDDIKEKKDPSSPIVIDGVNYKIGGKTDCCGFTRYCYEKIFKRDIGNSAKSQLNTSKFTKIAARLTGGNENITVNDGTKVKLSSSTNGLIPYLKPGDLLFFCVYRDGKYKANQYKDVNAWQLNKQNITHVALYAGGGKVLECGSKKGGRCDISECNLTQKSYRFVCAMRVPV